MHLKLLRALLLCALSFALVACGGHDDTEDAPIASKVKTTVMLYIVASDLIVPTANELRSMAGAKASSDINVILQIGGGKDAGPLAPAGIDMQITKRYRLVPDPEDGHETWTIEALPVNHQPPQVAMNQPGTLQDFLKWGAKEFPAEQYVLTMMDHGGGPNFGFGNDFALGEGKSLSLADIRTAIDGAGVHFELLSFDACLMGSLEVATTLAPYANYMVAAEDVSYIGTARWNTTLNFLAANPDAKGMDIGKTMVDAYADTVEGEVSATTFAVTDLSKVGELIAVLEETSSMLKSVIDTRGFSAWRQMAIARHEAQDFVSNIFSTTTDLVDLKSWIAELGKTQLISPSVEAKFNAAHDAAVIYKQGDEDDVNGLTVYFPRYSVLNTRLLDRYSSLDFSPTFQDLVRTYSNFAQNSEQMPRLAVGPTTYEGGAVTASISISGQSQEPADSSRLYDQGFAVLIKDGVALSMQPVLAEANVLRMLEPNMWPSVDGQFVTLLPEDADDDSIHLIPAMRLADQTPGMLIAERSDSGGLLIRGYISQTAFSASTAAALKIEPGTQFLPILYDLAHNKMIVSAQALTAPKADWEVQMITANGEGYEIGLAASDLTGQVVSTTQTTPLLH